jgi:ParB family chromosome partitioning protein
MPRRGGRIAHDLFEDRRHLTDPALLDRLAAEKLDAAAAAMVAGGAWAWVETCAEAHVSWAEIEKGLAARVYPVEGDLTEAEAERYAELAELANADVLDAEGQADLDALSRTLDGDYTAEQRAVAGAILAIDYDGEMRLHGGLIRKADREAAIAAGVIAPARGVAGEDAEPASPAFSARLTADLEAVARAARQHAVLAKPDLLLDLLAFQLSGRVGHRAIFALRHGDVANAPGTATGFAPDARIAAARHAPADPWTADRGARLPGVPQDRQGTGSRRPGAVPRPASRPARQRARPVDRQGGENRHPRDLGAHGREFLRPRQGGLSRHAVARDAGASRHPSHGHDLRAAEKAREG